MQRLDAGQMQQQPPQQTSRNEQLPQPLPASAPTPRYYADAGRGRQQVNIRIFLLFLLAYVRG